MNARIYLDRPKADGLYRLKFHMYINGKVLVIKTSIYLEEGKWDKKEQRYSVKVINDRIQEFRKFFEGLDTLALREGVPLTREYVKNKWDEIRGKKTTEEPEKKLPLFLEYFDIIPDRHKNKLTPATLSKFNQVKLQLTEFNPEIGFDDITEQFYDEYNDFLISEAKNRSTGEIGLSNNTIGKHWDKIRIVCREARKDGVIVNPCFEDFKSPSQHNQPIWLTKEEASAIGSANLSGLLAIVRDEFMARYYTSLRTSDMDQVNKKMILKIEDNYYLRFIIQKTSKDLTIPLHTKAVELLERYDYKFPYLALQLKNRYIKDICKESGIKTPVIKTIFKGKKRISSTHEKWELITTHTARRSFGRRFMESVNDINLLREIFGHADTKTTVRYIGWEDQELAQSVNRISF